MQNPTHTTPVNEQTRACPTPSTPNFEMDDFEDLVRFHRKADALAHGEDFVPSKASEKKCPFCS